MLVAPLPRRTGFVAFLQAQRRPTDEAFASMAAQAAQRWQAMEESERQGYGVRARSRPRRKAKARRSTSFGAGRGWVPSKTAPKPSETYGKTMKNMVLEGTRV